MQARLTPLLLALVLLASCDSRIAGQKSGPLLKADGDDLILPSFEIVLSIDEKARQKLQSAQEGIVVLAYFTGRPNKNAEEKYPEFQVEREISLANASFDVANGTSVTIENVRIPRAKYEDLADPDINVLVNVVSARQSSSQNLLDCGIVQGKLSDILGQTFVVNCRLIED